MNKLKKKTGLSFTGIFLILLAGLFLGVVCAACAGKYDVTPQEVIRILFASLSGKDSGLPLMKKNVVMGLRMPRIAASLLTGAALSVSGAVYQGIFRNPLISPDFLGVSSGACTGAAIAILLSLSSGMIATCAFCGGIGAVLLASLITASSGNRSNIMLVLAGVITGSLMSSVLGLIKFIADPMTQLASITYWTMGSFSYATWGNVALLVPLVLIPTVILILISWWIDVLSQGEEDARMLGANVKLIRGISIACATLQTAGAVCVAGNIGWVGLIVPHFCRMIAGPVNRKLIPLSALAGALFMLAVDTLTRTVSAEEIPVSILTGLIGAPVYCFLLYRQRSAER